MAQGKTGKKTAVKRPARKVVSVSESEVTGPRRLKLPQYKLFRLKRIKYPEKLPSVWTLTVRTWQLFRRRPVLFLLIALVNLLLTITLVRGFGGGLDVGNLRDELSIGPGKVAQVLTGVSVFVALFAVPSTAGNTSSGIYQVMIFIIITLATIWAARQTLAGYRVRLRDAFYKGMYPLIPFLLILLVITLESLPMIIGLWLYTTIIVDGIAVSLPEHLIWGGICLALVLVSIYMFCSSLFALYIVTLPDMTPVRALRSARQLVRYRRGQVLRKLLYLPVALLVLLAVVMVPVIILAAAAAPWVFFGLATLALVVVHLYMYTLYKALLA